MDRKRKLEVASNESEQADKRKSGGDSRWASLADRLNPNRAAFDPELKARWATMPQQERAAIIKKDKQEVQARKNRAKMIVHPFPVDDDDHCETSPEAYKHVAPILELFAKLLGKPKEKLAIYDPYYCAGSMERHLGALGFGSVYNRCEDFYQVTREGRTPEHDVLVTNPPYSAEHVEKLLRFCHDNGKPYLLCMPSYVRTKDYYFPSLGCKSARSRRAPLFLCPKKRYDYWTPEGLRKDQNQKGHKNLYLGLRNSPFVSFWYVMPQPLMSRKELCAWWTENGGNVSGNLGTGKVLGTNTMLVRDLSELPEQGWAGGGGRF